jgi:heavy metal sensor kinase
MLGLHNRIRNFVPARRMPMTFRLRLTLWYSALLISIVAVFSIAVFTVLERTMRGQVDSSLEDILDEIETDLLGYVIVNDEGEPVLLLTPFYPNLRTLRTPGTVVQLWRKDMPNYPTNLSSTLSLYNTPIDPEALSEDREIRRDVTLEKTEFRVITRPLKTTSGLVVGHVQAAQSLETINAASEQFLRIMLVASGIALLASILLGDWLARHALDPITKITRTAEQIVKAEDLDSRIPYNGSKDELGYLITTLNDMVARLEDVFTAQQRFVADVSHELRTPLTAIQSHLDLIQRFGLQDNGDPSLKAVRSETERMTRLVGDLLTLAQADLGNLSFTDSDVDLDTLLLDVFNQAVLLSKGELKVDLHEIDQLVVAGDGDRLKQLLLNLVTNAIKYTPAGGKITLSLEQVDGWAEIKVADTGIGIPPEDLPHIFDRFYRVDKARARAAGGVGLGLSIAKWIADAHHGNLSVESNDQQGTTFTLRLPLKVRTNGPSESHAEPRSRFPKFRAKRSGHTDTLPQNPNHGGGWDR